MSAVARWLIIDERPASRAEKRLSKQFLDYWERLRGQKPYPLITDLDLNEIRRFAPNTFNLDLSSDAENPIFRFVGRELERDCQQNVTNKGLSDLRPQGLLWRAIQHREKVLTFKRPFIVSDRFVDTNGFETRYRAVMLPFSSDGQKVDSIIGAISSKTFEHSGIVEGPVAQAITPELIDEAALRREIDEAVPPFREMFGRMPPSSRSLEDPGLIGNAQKAMADSSSAEPASREPGTERRTQYTGGASSGQDGHVIVLGGTKGGTGKSTCAMHLIVSLLSQGYKVGSIDLDSSQGTLKRYIENRQAMNRQRRLNLPSPKQIMISDRTHDFKMLEDDLRKLASSCDFVVIDTPGSDTAVSRRAHAWADTLITPINDSFVDLDTLAVLDAKTHEVLRRGHYAKMVAHARKQKAARSDRDIDWIVLRNRLSNLDARNKRQMADVLEKLSGDIGFRPGPGLSERVIYRELFLMGLTLLDLCEHRSSIALSMSHIAARQELRLLIETIRLPSVAQAGRA